MHNSPSFTENALNSNVLLWFHNKLYFCGLCNATMPSFILLNYSDPLLWRVDSGFASIKPLQTGWLLKTDRLFTWQGKMHFSRKLVPELSKCNDIAPLKNTQSHARNMEKNWIFLSFDWIMVNVASPYSISPRVNSLKNFKATEFLIVHVCLQWGEFSSQTIWLETIFSTEKNTRFCLFPSLFCIECIVQYWM